MATPRIIKKYPNRRLYDTETSTYAKISANSPLTRMLSPRAALSVTRLRSTWRFTL